MPHYTIPGDVAVRARSLIRLFSPVFCGCTWEGMQTLWTCLYHKQIQHL